MPQPPGGGRRPSNARFFTRPGGRGPRFEKDPYKSWFRNHAINPKLARHARMAWEREGPSTTTFRLFPEPDPLHPGQFYDAWLPGYTGDGVPTLGSWLVAYPVARIDGAVWILHDPATTPDRSWDAGDDRVCRDNPVNEVYWAARSKDNGQPEWRALTDEDDDRTAFSRPREAFFAYGAIYAHGPDRRPDPPYGLEADKLPLILDLGSMTGAGVMQIALALKEEYREALPEGLEDCADFFANPDPVRIDAGLFFHAWPKTRGGPNELFKLVRTRAPGGLVIEPPVDDDEELQEGAKKAIRPAIGYDVRATTHALVERKTAAGATKQRLITASLVDHTDQLWRKLKPFDEVFIFPTHQEQIAYLCKYLTYDRKRPALDLIQHTFEHAEEHPEWLGMIPSEALRAFRGTVTVDQAPATGSHPTPDLSRPRRPGPATLPPAAPEELDAEDPDYDPEFDHDDEPVPVADSAGAVDLDDDIPDDLDDDIEVEPPVVTTPAPPPAAQLRQQRAAAGTQAPAAAPAPRPRTPRPATPAPVVPPPVAAPATNPLAALRAAAARLREAGNKP